MDLRPGLPTARRFFLIRFASLLLTINFFAFRDNLESEISNLQFPEPIWLGYAALPSLCSLL